MPRGIPKNPAARRKSLTQIAAESAPLSAPPAEQPPTPADRLAAMEIPAASLPAAAAAEELTGTNAYTARRISELSKNDVMAKLMKIRQIARKKNYRLDNLVHTPDLLQNALDEFDITCFSLGIYPLQEILSFWLNTTRAQLLALSSAANISESGKLIAMHNDYCISVISSTAFAADKPPVFSIYYLKSVYSMFDNPHPAGNISTFGAASITQNITINAADISKKSQLFTEIDVDGGENPK